MQEVTGKERDEAIAGAERATVAVLESKGKLMRWTLSVLLMWSSFAAQAATCPEPVREAPAYPDDMRRARIQGSLVLDLRVDACGKVLDAAIAESSGHASFDASALAASRGWVLSRDAIAGAVDGRLRVPLDFKLPQHRSYPYVGNDDWPATHRRARYVLEGLPGYATPEAVLNTHDLQPEVMLTPPYKYVRNMLFRQRGAEPREYWLFIYMGDRASVAARYRLVTENGEPVVRLAFLCEGAEKDCARDRKLVMRGLPFAKAK
jgi:TonB family protein